MLGQNILWEEEGIIGIADRGEDMYGRRHFLQLLSVFLSPPLFCVLHGRQELGFVDDHTFLGKQAGARVLLLGGRAWRVKHIDWQRRTAYVEPSEDQGRSRWQGAGQPLGYSLCQAIARVLSGDQVGTAWSRRAADKLAEVRQDFWWVAPGESAVVSNTEGGTTWWTFGGAGANATLAAALSRCTGIHIAHDPLKLGLQRPCRTQAMYDAIGEVRSQNLMELLPEIDEPALEGLKFSECLPKEMGVQMLQLRLRDTEALKKILAQPVRFVSPDCNEACENRHSEKPLHQQKSTTQKKTGYNGLHR
jgi:ATP-dependent Lhr-like helicase